MFSELEVDFQELLLTHVKKLIKKFKCDIQSELHNIGCNLTNEEIYIYILIVYKKINTVSEINKQLFNSHKSNVSRMIKHLIQQKYIVTIPDNKDKRVKHFISCNEKFKNQFSQIIVKTNNKYKNKVNEQEYQVFLQIINKMVK